MENGGDDIERGQMYRINRAHVPTTVHCRKIYRIKQSIKVEVNKGRNGKKVRGREQRHWRGGGVFLEAEPEKDLCYCGSRDRCPSTHSQPLFQMLW